MNKETFLRLVPKFNEDLKPDNSGEIFSMRLPLDNYDYNYEYAIIGYMKECGCNIHRTNWNFFGGFYIYYTKPTKYISPSEYVDNYKERFYWVKNNHLIIIAFVLFLILVALIAYAQTVSP